MADINTTDQLSAAEKAAAEKAAADAALAEKAATEAAAAADKSAAAKWKGKSYAELADEHNRLLRIHKHDEAAAFHRKFVATFKDK